MSNEVSFRIVREDGREFVIDGKTWGIPNDGLENWGFVAQEVSVTEAVSFDGGMILGERVASTDRTLTAILKDTSQNEAQRKALLGFFNPKTRYDVHVKYMGLKRWCTGVQYMFKASEGNVYRPLSFTWTILCDQPYFLSEDDFGKDVAALMPKFGFPFHSVIDVEGDAMGVVYPRGYITGKYQFENVVSLKNNGDTDTNIRVRIKATGDVVNPEIDNGKKFVRYLGTLHKDDILDIDFTQRPPTVELNGKSVIHKTDRESSYVGFELKVGVNKIRYRAENGDTNMSVSVYYNQMYTGV